MEESGGRVSNAWATYREVGDNLAKAGLIPNVVISGHPDLIEGGSFGTCRFMRGPRPISLLVR